MAHDIFLALWFLLPAAAANSAPVFAAAAPGLKHLNAPIDGGRTFRNKLLFGPHKTWRGIVVGILVATIVFWLEQLLFEQSTSVRSLTDTVPYSHLPTLLLGPLFGLGALGGDAAKSFLKRQKGIASGDRWLPFDQLDYIIGAVIVSLPFVILTPLQYLLIFILWFGMHVLATSIGYLLGLKAKPI